MSVLDTPAVGGASDLPPTAEEKQLWVILGELEEDVDPGSHACRLRLSLATRCCPELSCPWQMGEQLLLYLAKVAVTTVTDRYRPLPTVTSPRWPTPLRPLPTVV